MRSALPRPAPPGAAVEPPPGSTERLGTARFLAWFAPPAVAAAARVANGPLTVDDAFITFRYAENLRSGYGLVYNPGEAVLGTTTPLYAALLALLPLPMGSLPTAALWLNALLDAAVCAVLVWIAFRLSGHLWTGAVAGLAYALAPMSIAFSAGGMETPLFVLLVLSAFALGIRGSDTAAMGLAALATLTRPEGGLVAALLVLDRLSRTRRIPWRLGLVYLGLLVPWAIYAQGVYGSPIPHSMTAKAGTYVVDPWTNLAALALGAGLPGFSVFPLSENSGAIALGVAAVGLVALYGLARAGSRLGVAGSAVARPLLLFAPVYALAYALAGLRGVRLFQWYLVPLIPFYGLYVALGLCMLARRWRLSPIAALAAAGALVLVWDGLALGVSRGILDRPTYPVGFALERERIYRQVGLDLQPRLRPGDEVAAPEIGALGYYSRAHILDTVGLVSPGVGGYYPLPRDMLVADNAIPPRLIQDRQPRFVLALDQFLRRSLLQSDWFTAHYVVVQRYPAPIWRSTEVLVYERNASP